MKTSKQRAQKKYREKLKTLGLCPRCGKKTEENKSLCLTCKDKRYSLLKKERERKIKAAEELNLCIECSNPKQDLRLRRCDHCRFKFNAKQLGYYHKRKNKKLRKLEKELLKELPSRRKLYQNLEVPIGTPGDTFPPTEALPSSVEKLDVMCHRYDNGLPLFNPNDAAGCQQVTE